MVTIILDVTIYIYIYSYMDCYIYDERVFNISDRPYQVDLFKNDWYSIGMHDTT